MKFDQKEYINRFNKENYDTVVLRLPKGKREIVKASAKEAGKSMNAFILQCVSEKIEGKKMI